MWAVEIIFMFTPNVYIYILKTWLDEMYMKLHQMNVIVHNRFIYIWMWFIYKYKEQNKCPDIFCFFRSWYITNLATLLSNINV